MELDDKKIESFDKKNNSLYLITKIVSLFTFFECIFIGAYASMSFLGQSFNKEWHERQAFRLMTKEQAAEAINRGILILGIIIFIVFIIYVVFQYLDYCYYLNKNKKLNLILKIELVISLLLALLLPYILGIF